MGKKNEMSNSINNVKPSNSIVKNTAPKNGTILNLKPSNKTLQSPNFVYTENRTILKGQPIIWGLNWLITYPVQFSFTGVRL